MIDITNQRTHALRAVVIVGNESDAASNRADGACNGRSQIVISYKSDAACSGRGNSRVQNNILS